MLPTADIVQQRLYSQRLSWPHGPQAEDVVAWMGAVQAQEYAHARWALGLRVSGATDAAIEQALTDGRILRTHVMRPTWHFVAPADIRWLLALTAPRVHAVNAHMYRKFEVDAALLLRSNAVIAKALEGGRHLTRAELATVLGQAGIVAAGTRLVLIMMGAELDGIICSGARRGKQFTYALLDERVPQARPLSRDEALAELTRRYFTSHGPATIQDFAWWSGLTQADVKAGLELVHPAITHELIDGKRYWFAASNAGFPSAHDAPGAFLVPPFDEYTIAYRDHSALLEPAHAATPNSALFNGVLVVNGIIIGNWQRTLNKGEALLTFTPFRPLSDAEQAALSAAAQRYSAFLGLPATVVS